jgi:hypothetical protein
MNSGDVKRKAMLSKRDELREFLERQAREALLLHTATMQDRAAAETIRANARLLSGAVAFNVTEEYRFLELADIMEWKRERIRR